MPTENPQSRNGSVKIKSTENPQSRNGSINSTDPTPHKGMTAHPIVTVLVVLVGRTQRDSRNALFTRSNAGYLQNAKDQLLHP